MHNVCMHLFGFPNLVCNTTQKKIVLPYIKLMLLLAYLTLEGRPLTREFLADLFWPNLDVNDARANLRRALFNLQQACQKTGLQPFSFHTNRCTIHLSQEFLWTDALAFESHANADSVTTMERKIALYRGPFMEGVYPADETLATWVGNRRMRYEQQYISLLEQVIVHASSAENFEATKRFCRQLIDTDNLNEIAHLHLIRISMKCGAQVTAQKIYNNYCQTLHRELGMPPSQQLKAIVGLT